MGARVLRMRVWEFVGLGYESITVFFPMQILDVSDNPKLEFPPKPVAQTIGAGAEFYNIEFDTKLLRQGAVQASGKSAKSKFILNKF